MQSCRGRRRGCPVPASQGNLYGRSAEVRASTADELAAVLVLALPIAEWSLKVSEGWPDDPPADVAGPAWAGVLPVMQRYEQPLAAPDLRDGVPLPASVQRLLTS